MKSIRRMIKFLVKKQITLPSELLNLPTVTITGDKQIAIEQHYRLISFSDAEIKLQCENGIIQINGQTLMIKMMYAREIILEGMIEQIIFHK